MGANLRTVMGPTLGKVGDLVAILASLKVGDILFIDEIHRLRKPVEEILYPAMEDGHVDVVLGDGPGARTVRLNLEPFTLIGATTRTGMLSAPFRDRFGHVAILEPYDPETLAKIVVRAAQLDGQPITVDAAEEIGTRGRGTPRVALTLLDRCSDYAKVRGGGSVDRECVLSACHLFGVDRLGLDAMDRRILEVLTQRFMGEPVGLSTLAGILDTDPATIESEHEGFLMRAGLISRTPRGRVALPAAWEHLGTRLGVAS
jgi:Holliday junction DNA helicase RuvB